MSEIEQMPVSEFDQHKWFWEDYRWGMQDDLISIGITNHMKSVSTRSKVEPWMVKQWTTQKDYTYRLAMTRLIVKPVEAVRSGFMAIVDAVKGLMNGKQHQ